MILNMAHKNWNERIVEKKRDIIFNKIKKKLIKIDGVLIF